MFKEYTQAGHQSEAENRQNKVGVDLMTITSYILQLNNYGYVTLIGHGLNTVVYMTEAEFEEFKVNLKTANRLKRVYE